MSKYIDSIELVTETCCSCGMTFAMPSDYQRRRRDDKKLFFCPSGHQQHYTGPSAETRLREELERQKQMLESERVRAIRIEAEKAQVMRAHMRMRTRIMNGVCPCCNRTFQNLMQHMQTEHKSELDLKTLRTAYGMSQASIAKEIGIRQGHVSAIENGRSVAPYIKRAVDTWIESQAVKKELSAIDAAALAAKGETT